MPCHEVEECLLAAGSHITTAQDGEGAINRVEHAAFDITVLVSTGKFMDLVETYFNIRDINPSMEIIILAENDDAGRDSVAEVIARTFPRTHSLTLDGLARTLGLDWNTPR
jgi:DNA-binding NarL/FixJ family response regulator